MAVMDPALERAYRNRMSLPPAERAAVEQAYAAALAAHEDSYYGRAPAHASETSPADLDPVEAAATPLTPDPIVRPRARTTENAPPGIGLPDGFSEFSAGMAVASGDKPRAERLKDADAFDARVDRMAEDYNRATGMPQPSGLAMNDGYRDWSGWQPGMPVPKPGRRGMRAGEPEGDIEPAGYTLPGPRTLDGKPVRRPQPLATEEQAAAYKERGTDPETGRRKKSQYDLDMEARGYTAVVMDDGTVSYRTTYAPATDDPTGRGAIGRAGDRVDLRNSRIPGTDTPRYEPREMMTPTGEKVQVWVQTEDARKYTEQERNTRTRGRLADQAGLGAVAASSMSDAELREQVRAARMRDKQARANAWRAQSMLAGGQPTGGPGGTKVVANALMMLNDPSLSEEQRQSLRYMLPGGALAAQVDARQLDMAAGLARNAITGALAGTAQGPMAAAQAELAQLQAQAERDKLRAADEDVLGEKYAPAGWLGYDEFTIAEQQRMYDDLIAQGYKPAEAQRAVDRQSAKRRATQKQRWSDAGA